MRKDRYTDPRLDEGYIDEHGHYRGADDRDAPAGLFAKATAVAALLVGFGAFGWGVAQACRLFGKLLGL